jgi:hypothetical protein
MVHLCPPGSEGAAYAMFTTVNNAAGSLAGTVSTMFLGIWDVSSERLKLRPPDVSGLWKLSLLTTVIQTAGILFVPMLPAGKDELQGLNFQSKSKIGGVIFVFVLTASVLWAIVTAVLNVLFPTWSGAS